MSRFADSKSDGPDPLSGCPVVHLPGAKAFRLKSQASKLRQAVALIEGVAKDREPGDPDLTGHLAISMAAALDANSVLLEATR